jgi:hypothetical protein
MRSSKPVFDCDIVKNHLLLEPSLRGEIGIIKNISICPKTQEKQAIVYFNAAN